MRDSQRDSSSDEVAKTSAPVDPLELRSSPRVGADLPVEIYSTDFGGALLGRTRDLSIGGACLATECPFAIKTVQRIRLSMPTGDLTMDAVGCWQREDPHDRSILTGVAFENPHPDQLEVVWDQVLDAGKKLARFLYERTAIHELGLEESMGLAQVTRYRNIGAGQLIYRQGTMDTTSDALFLLIQGQVGLQVRVRDAIEVPLGRLQPGELFGGLPLLAELPHAETAVAETDVRLLEIDRAAFRHVRSTKPWLGHRLGVAMLRVHAQRLTKTMEVVGARL